MKVLEFKIANVAAGQNRLIFADFVYTIVLYSNNLQIKFNKLLGDSLCQDMRLGHVPVAIYRPTMRRGET
jgi:hypothetical protein